MSGKGAPQSARRGRRTGPERRRRSQGTWHATITDGLLAGRPARARGGRRDVALVRVPGSFELPVVAKAALRPGPTRPSRSA